MSLSNKLTSVLPPLPPQLQSRPILITAAAAAAALGLLPVVSLAADSYRGFLALGPGGLPHNVLGWLVQGVLQVFARHDTRDPSPLARPAVQALYAPHGRTSFLRGGAELPERQPPRPIVPGYVAPQRQTTDVGAPETVARMTAFLRAVAAANPDLLAIKPSGLEGVGTPALWLVEDGTTVQVPAYMARIRGEIAHVHHEGSSHVTLSPADAEVAVRRGWAERHMLSGVKAALPWGYVLLYAPRDRSERDIWAGLVMAGCRFVCAGAAEGREVVEPVWEWEEESETV